MKLFNMAAIIALTFVGCAHCGTSDEAPYIRTQPGIEYCGDMCNKFKELKCTGYYEDLDIDCKKDLVYSDMQICKDALAADSGMAKLTCVQFCEYEMKNSVQLEPKCLVDNLLVCSEIETICK
jgi:hypothetical protein